MPAGFLGTSLAVLPNLSLCVPFFLCYSSSRYDFHRDEANYHSDVYVDYLD